VERELRVYLAYIQVTQLAESEAVSVGYFRSPDVCLYRRDSPLDAAAGGVEMVHYIYGRTFFHPGAGTQQAHHIARKVEVPRTYILNLYYQRIEAFQFFLGELDVIGSGSKLGSFRLKYLYEIASLTENIIQILSGRSIEAVLGTETTHAAL
jgi:hypothetical protein